MGDERSRGLQEGAGGGDIDLTSNFRTLSSRIAYSLGFCEPFKQPSSS